MQYLIFLNRFDQDRNILLKKLESVGVKLLDEEFKALKVEATSIEPCLQFQEIAQIVQIVVDWKPHYFASLGSDALKTIKTVQAKQYVIKTKFHEKIPISAKSIYKHINPDLKKEGYIPSETAPEAMLYVEFTREGRDPYYRMSVAPISWVKTVEAAELSYNQFAVMLENPQLVEEVSDFLRLCWIFKLPLYIVTRNPEFPRLLNKAKEITKGIQYDIFKLQILQQPPSGFTLVGFSKLARDNEQQLKPFLIENKEKLLLVFGDDKFGLTQEMRNKMQHMFRLTPDTKKPLRASHALSYVLGLYTAATV